MDKYEYRVKTEQMLEYMEQKAYGKAMEIADTIDWRKVKNASMLCSVSEIYEQNESMKKAAMSYSSHMIAPREVERLYTGLEF